MDLWPLVLLLTDILKLNEWAGDYNKPIKYLRGVLIKLFFYEREVIIDRADKFACNGSKGVASLELITWKQLMSMWTVDKAVFTNGEVIIEIYDKVYF